MTSTATLYAAGSVYADAGLGSWATTGNATGAPDSAYAVYTGGSSGNVGRLGLSGYAAQAAIGAQPASVDQVQVTVTWHCATASRWSSVTVALWTDTPANSGSQIGSSQSLTLSTVSTNAQTLTFTGADVPTWAQLAALTVFIEATRTGASSSTVSIDAAGVAVSYSTATAAAPGLAPGTGAAYVVNLPASVAANAGLASGAVIAPQPALAGTDNPPPPPPPGYIGRSAVVISDGSSLDPVTPVAETQPGDLLLFHFYASVNTAGPETLDLLPGWSWVRYVSYPGSGGLAAAALRVCQPGDTSFAWATEGFAAGDTICCWADTWRGQDATDPVTASEENSGGPSSTSFGLTAPVPAPVMANDTVVQFLGAAGAGITGQDALSGDGLTWEPGLLQSVTLGAGASVAQQFGSNAGAATATLTDKSLTVTGLAVPVEYAAVTYVVHMDPAGVAFRAGFSPVQVSAATGSVTGTWASGQVPAAGGLLVAAVSAEATTSAAAISTPSGWAKAGEANGTSVRVAFYWKVAAGSDAAPAFTSVLSGSSQGMTAALYELTGALLSAPVATSGTAAGTTANPLAVTTAGNVPVAGCMGLACHAMYRSTAAANAWTKDAAWVNDASNGSLSQRPHAACDHLTSPVPGAALADGGTWVSAPSAEAAMSVVIAPQPSAAATAGLAAATGDAPGAVVSGVVVLAVSRAVSRRQAVVFAATW